MSTATATQPSTVIIGGGGGGQNHHNHAHNSAGSNHHQQQQSQQQTTTGGPGGQAQPNIIQLAGGRCGPSLVTFKNLRFLITDKPTDPTLTQYIEELQRRKVTDVVRVCESTYSAKRLQQAGIECHDWAFDDGTPPPNQIITDWLNLILERFKPGTAPSSGSSSPTAAQNGGISDQQQQSSQQTGPCIAVHCVAGLGRAPVLVAIALIEAGMKYEDAVEMIRDVRRGAINAKQLSYLAQYRPKKVLLQVINGAGAKRKFCCIV